MNNKALVSIIIPAYNVAPYIEKCVKSICNQSYSNIEVIVINDGSTDDTDCVVRKISEIDNRIRYFSRDNAGVSATRNFGIEQSKGEYLIFVDGDDFLSTVFVENMIGLLERLKADFCFSTDCYISDKESQNSCIIEKSITSEEATAMLLSPRVEVGCWNKMFKKSLLDKHNIRFDTSLYYGEGLRFITMVSQLANTVAITNRKMYYYRQDNNKSATKHFDVGKIYNGFHTLNLIEETLIKKDSQVLSMLELHKCLFCLGAVTKILVANAKNDYELVYAKNLSYVRKHALRCVLDKSLTNVERIKLLMCCICPNFMSRLSIYCQKRRASRSVK